MVLVMEPAAPVRDAPARQALAQAITRHQATQADHAATAAALGVAEEAVLELRSRLDAAEEALRQAPQAAADHLMSVARGSAGPVVPMTARECRERQADLEDELLASRSSRDLLRQRVPQDAERVKLAEMTCREAALGVMRAECAPAGAELVAELERVQQEAARLGRVAEWLAGARVIEMAGAARATVARHQTPPSGWFRTPGAPDPARAWQDALSGLERDPEAPAFARMRP